MPTLSPNEAAVRSGVSRRSIMRAIEAGVLSAQRNNRNQWQIDEDALAQWARSGPAQLVAQVVPTSEAAVVPAVLEERIRGLERLVEEMRSEREALRADRDALRDALRVVSERRPWWRRVAG